MLTPETKTTKNLRIQICPQLSYTLIMRFSLRLSMVGVLMSMLLMFATALPASAQTGKWSGVCVAGSVTGGEDVATIQGLQCLIANIFTVIITVIGLAGFVMFIWGSFTWLLSGGNPKGVENARNTMLFAVVGLIVALSGFIILNLISAFTGVDVTRFFIPGPGENRVLTPGEWSKIMSD